MDNVHEHVASPMVIQPTICSKISLSPRLCMNPTISKQKWRRRSIPLSVALRLALPATNEWNHHESLEHMYISIYIDYIINYIVYCACLWCRASEMLAAVVIFCIILST